jgi:outer membrane lipoprotein-sorting protein
VKLRGYILLILILLAAGLWAQTPQEEIFRHPLEPQTMNAFITTCSRLAEHAVVQGSFEQEKTLSKLDRSLKSSGNFIIAAGLGMVWDTVKPFPSTLTLGKDYLIQSRPGGQKTVLSAQGNETFLRMAEVISAVFSGNSQGLLENFKVYYSGNGGLAGGPADTAWELGLSPLNSAIGSFAEKIIMKGDTAIRSILIYDQNGDTVRYILSNHRYPAELNVNEKALFSFS